MRAFVEEFRDKLSNSGDVRVTNLIGLDKQFLNALNEYSHVKVDAGGTDEIIFLGVVTKATEEMYFEKFVAREITVLRGTDVLFKYIEIKMVEDGRVVCEVIEDRLKGDWDGCTKLCKLLQGEIDLRNRIDV